MSGPGHPDRRRAVRRDEEARLREIIDHVADGIVIVSAEGRVLFVNPAAERLFGRRAAELLGHPFGFPLVAEETAEIDVVRRSGDTRVAELRMALMEWEREPATLVSLRDITDRKEAEERLHQLVHEQAARWRAEAEERRARFLADAGTVLDSSLDYHAVLNQLARLVVAPQSALAPPAPGRAAPPRLADWCVIDIQEREGELERVALAHHDPAREPLLEELRQRFPPALDRPYPATRALRQGTAQLYREMTDEVLGDVTQGPAHAALLRRLGISSAMAVPLIARGETLGALIFACEGHGYGEADLALAQDLAQRAALSIANARLYREAQRANQAKSDFLAVMSHELRTPLNAIIGYTELLSTEVVGPLDPRQKQQLERIDHSSRHLLQIVDEILSFARVEAGREEVHLEPTDLAGLMEEVGLMIRPLAERKGLRFTVAPPPRPAMVETDPGKVRQVLLNLLSNAVKFTDQGEVQLRAVEDGNGYVLRVADTGIGIAPEHLQRIFEPFWQVEQSHRRTGGGTGLGLSVAHRFARILGGSLDVESRPGAGTTFAFRLPAVAGQREGERPRPAAG